MIPYAQSGHSARLRLMTRDNAPRAAMRVALRDSLRMLKRVINTLCVCGLVTVVGVAALSGSPEAAASCAVLFLAGVVLLEIMERRLKRRLRAVQTAGGQI
jgi:hypothetical protein